LHASPQTLFRSRARRRSPGSSRTTEKDRDSIEARKVGQRSNHRTPANGHREGTWVMLT
jgi:hypothetical protein